MGRHCRPHRLFFFLQVSLVERGKKTLQIHIGQGSVGQQIKPEDRLFELSGRKKDCPGLSPSRSWIKLPNANSPLFLHSRQSWLILQYGL